MKPKPQPPPDGCGVGGGEGLPEDGLPAPITPGIQHALAAQPHLDSSWQLQHGGGAVAAGMAIKGKEEAGGRGDTGQGCLQPHAPLAKGAASVALSLRPGPVLSHSAGSGETETSAPSPSTAPWGKRRGGGSPADTVSSRGLCGTCLCGHKPRADGAQAPAPVPIGHPSLPPFPTLICPFSPWPQKVAPPPWNSPGEMLPTSQQIHSSAATAPRKPVTLRPE